MIVDMMMLLFEYDRNYGFKVRCFYQGSGLQIKSEKDGEGCFCFSREMEIKVWKEKAI